MGWRWMDNVLWRQNGGDILGRSKGGRRRNGDRDGSLLRDRGREEDEERAGGRKANRIAKGGATKSGWMDVIAAARSAPPLFIYSKDLYWACILMTTVCVCCCCYCCCCPLANMLITPRRHQSQHVYYIQADGEEEQHVVVCRAALYPPPSSSRAAKGAGCKQPKQSQADRTRQTPLQAPPRAISLMQ
jgi:hypothetical protein